MMRHALLATMLFLGALSNVMGASLPDDLVKALSDTIWKRCPEARIEITEHAFIAKHGTMIFTLHSRSETGEFFPQTYREEGPNSHGFILRVALHEGKYRGAATVPQTLQGPYFRTFIDAPATDDGKTYYQVHFSYGKRLDPQLKEAILEAIPKTRFQQPNRGDAEKPRASPRAPL